MRNFLPAVTFSVLLIAAGAARAQSAESGGKPGAFRGLVVGSSLPLEQYYLYDRDLPLDAVMELMEETALYTKYRLLYAGVNDQTVPALYLVPKGEGPFPVLLFMGGKGGSKEAVLPFADAILKEGFAVLSPEPQYHGERGRPGKTIINELIFTSIDAVRQTVLDYRRGIDFLETRPEIRQDAILYMGGSMGGILGAIICGVDERVDAAILTVAGGPWTYMAQTTMDPDRKNMNARRKALGLSWEELQAYLDPVDPMTYIGGISPRPLLMINASHDLVVKPKAAENLWKRAGEPKEIRWMEANHWLPYDELLPELLAWFRAAVPAIVGK